MGPEDQHPWDREDEEIRQVFAEKDAEIEGLKALIAAKDAEIHRLKRELIDAVQNIQAHSMIVDASEKDAEIEELKALITELCDALEVHSSTYPGAPIEKLVTRAREALTI